MSDPNGSHDVSTGGDEGSGADGRHGAEEPSSRPVPEPVTDDATAELVRDAIDVARGELSDRRFSRKYGTGDLRSTEGGDTVRIDETDRSQTETDR